MAILNISSACGMVGGTGLGAYTSSKGDVRRLSRTAVREFGELNIRVSTIIPGTIITPMIDPNKAKLVEEFMVPRTPMQRVGYPDDIAYAALFPCSDEASFISGAEVPVDGGFLA